MYIEQNEISKLYHENMYQMNVIILYFHKHNSEDALRITIHQWIHW